jgi:hypothetical protein
MKVHTTIRPELTDSGKLTGKEILQIDIEHYRIFNTIADAEKYASIVKKKIEKIK